MYRIIFPDIDGTLLNGDRTLSETTIRQVKRLKNTVPFILVSSRTPDQMYHLQKDLGIEGSPIIAYNGGLVLNGEKALHSAVIPCPVLKEIVAINEEKFGGEMHISFYHSNKWYTPQHDQWAKREEDSTLVSPTIRPSREALSRRETEQKGAHKLMLMGETGFIESVFQLLGGRYASVMQVYKAKDTYIGVANISISKLTGVKIVLDEVYHLSLNGAIALGDNYNDLEMLKGVGYRVAVDNTRDEVKAVTKHLTDHRSRDGIASFLEKLWYDSSLVIHN